MSVPQIEPGPVVTVRVLFFAKSKDIVGASERPLTIFKLTTYKELLKLVIINFALYPIQRNIVLAKNGEIFDTEIDDYIDFEENDEIAVIPPLSGG